MAARRAISGVIMPASGAAATVRASCLPSEGYSQQADGGDNSTVNGKGVHPPAAHEGQQKGDGRVADDGRADQARQQRQKLAVELVAVDRLDAGQQPGADDGRRPQQEAEAGAFWPVKAPDQTGGDRAA